jgi:hypothetical protein
MTIDKLGPGEHELLIDGPAGKLQLKITIPATLQLQPICIVCHPHPLFQGSMNNKVVHRLLRVFELLGMRVIRFNFRGVEKSVGHYANGVGETEDLFAVMQWAKKYFSEPHFCLAGFSFGGYVAYRACSLAPFQSDIKMLVTVAPAVTHFNVSELRDIDCPWITIQGENDDVVEPQAVIAFVKSRPHSPQLITLPAAGHFFHGQLITLQTVLTEALLPYTDAWRFL